MEEHILDENFNLENSDGDLDKKTIARINNIKIYLNSKIRDVQTGRKTLVVMSIFFILASIIVVTRNGEVLSLTNPWEALMKAIIYLGCAIGVRINQKFSLIIGFVFFIFVQIFYAFIDLATCRK